LIDRAKRADVNSLRIDEYIAMNKYLQHNYKTERKCKTAAAIDVRAEIYSFAGDKYRF